MALSACASQKTASLPVPTSAVTTSLRTSGITSRPASSAKLSGPTNNLANQSMKHLLFAAAIAVALAACSSKPKSESGIVFDDGKTYEEVIAEPYTADKQ